MTEKRCPTCDKPVGPLHPWAVVIGYGIGIALSTTAVVVVLALAARVVAWAVRGVVS